MNKPRRYPRDYVLGDASSEYPFRVYVLYCPIEKQIRYVGYTSGALYYRLNQHRIEQRNCLAEYVRPKGAWIKRLEAAGLLPFMRCIAGFNDKLEALAFEAQMIQYIGERRLLYNLDMKLK